MTEPEVIIRFCEFVGLDSTKLQFKWTPARKEELTQLRDDTQRRMRSTLSALAGVLARNTLANLDINTGGKEMEGGVWQRRGREDGEMDQSRRAQLHFMKAKRLRPWSA